MSFDLSLASSPRHDENMVEAVDVGVTATFGAGDRTTRGGFVRQLSRAGGKRKRGYRGDGTTGVKIEATATKVVSLSGILCNEKSNG